MIFTSELEGDATWSLKQPLQMVAQTAILRQEVFFLGNCLLENLQMVVAGSRHCLSDPVPLLASL